MTLQTKPTSVEAMWQACHDIAQGAALARGNSDDREERRQGDYAALIANEILELRPESTIPSGRRDIDGVAHIGDGKGGWVPVDLIKPQHLLQDEVVRKIVGHADPLSDQVSRFAQHTFDDIAAFEALLAQEYGAKVGGKKGNKTLMTHDGLLKVTVQVADSLVFGPELQTAKALVDECLNEWASDARPEIRTLVTKAFDTDKEGQINRSHIYMLLRLDITDPRWVSAMQAIRDAMMVVGSKTYVRCYRRERFDALWQPITIDLARA